MTLFPIESWLVSLVSVFNWMSVDTTRTKLMQVSGGTSIGVPTAPVECSLWTDGTLAGSLGNASSSLTFNGGVANTGAIQFGAGSGVASGLMGVNGDLSLAGIVQIDLAPSTAMGRYPLYTCTGATATNTAVVGGISGSSRGKLSTSIPGRLDLVIDDSDEDHLPDSWEIQYLGNLASTPPADPDDDGQSYAIELQAGTHPASGNSRFAATIIPLDATQWSLAWPSGPGKFYRIETNGTLAGSWNLLSTFPAAAAPATATSYTVTKAASATFYRIVIAPWVSQIV